MIPETALALHVGHGQEVAFLEYLVRVGLYLVAFGGVALLTYWGAGAIETVRSAVTVGPERDEGDR